MPHHKSDGESGLRLNIRPIEAIVRLSVGLSLPFLLVLYQPLWLIIVIVASTTYLLVTVSLFFCPLKHFVQHQLAGRKKPTSGEQKMPFKEL